MSYIGMYRELFDGFAPELAKDLPSMQDSFADGPYPGQQAIADYLRKGNVEHAAGGVALDVFTGEPTAIIDNGRTDGPYQWGEVLAYYVEKYNLVLPEDFTEHVGKRVLLR